MIRDSDPEQPTVDKIKTDVSADEINALPQMLIGIHSVDHVASTSGEPFLSLISAGTDDGVPLCRTSMSVDRAERFARMILRTAAALRKKAKLAKKKEAVH